MATDLKMTAGKTTGPPETRRSRALAVALAISTILAGCSGVGSRPASHLAAFGLAVNPRPAAFDICRSYGCTETFHVSLSEAEWARVRTMFLPPPANARAERARAALAVGLLEKLVGPKAGTQYVMPRNEPGPPGTAQLDCLARASNTTVYLLLLERGGLLPRHRVGHPAHRGFLVFLPHNTAVLLERDNGRAWAIDSWYAPNGSPAAVWPMELWRAWKENEGNRENLGSD
jgi:hypothetical protein